MLKAFQYSVAAFVFFLAGFLPGCSAQTASPEVATSAAVAAAKPAFSLDTSVEKIAADRRGKAILDRDIPDLMSNRSYPMFEDMSLDQIASLSSGRLTQANLDVVKADLAKLSAEEKAGQ